MNVTKMHELTGGLKYWHDVLDKAKAQRMQLNSNIYTAEKEIALREKELRELLNEDKAK